MNDKFFIEATVTLRFEVSTDLPMRHVRSSVRRNIREDLKGYESGETGRFGSGKSEAEGYLDLVLKRLSITGLVTE